MKNRVAGTNSGVIAIDSVTMAISSDAVSVEKIDGRSRGRKQHEGELAALRQQQRDAHRVLVAAAEQPADRHRSRLP